MKNADLSFFLRDVKLEYKTLKQRQIEYNKKEKKLYGNMFARLSKLEALEPKEVNIYLLQWKDIKKLQFLIINSLQKAEAEAMDVEKSDEAAAAVGPTS